MTQNAINDLSKQIEILVLNHIAASHKAAEVALNRAFAAALGSPGKPRQVVSHSATKRLHRASKDVEALADQLYEAVCNSPGVGMAVFARQLGVAAAKLHLPMTHLKRSQRIRSVGQRQFTRYFPMIDERPA